MFSLAAPLKMQPVDIGHIKRTVHRLPEDFRHRQQQKKKGKRTVKGQEGGWELISVVAFCMAGLK